MFDPNQLKKTEAREQKEAEEKNRVFVEQDVAKTREVVEEEKTLRRGVLSINDLIAPASMEIFPSHLLLGEKYVRTIFIVSYPRYISVGWFAPIINLNSMFDVSMFFYPVKSAVILKQLKNKVGTLEAQIVSDAEKGAARDPLREDRKSVV